LEAIDNTLQTSEKRRLANHLRKVRGRKVTRSFIAVVRLLMGIMGEGESDIRVSSYKPPFIREQSHHVAPPDPLTEPKPWESLDSSRSSARRDRNVDGGPVSTVPVENPHIECVSQGIDHPETVGFEPGLHFLRPTRHGSGRLPLGRITLDKSINDHGGINKMHRGREVLRGKESVVPRYSLR
jgi:hypothetical protein